MTDNFEWAAGYCARFGLHTVDRTTAARAARASTASYANAAKTNKVTRAELDVLPPYGDPTYCE